MIIFSLLLASQRDRGGVSKSPALASNPQSIVVKHVGKNNRSFLHCKTIMAYNRLKTGFSTERINRSP